MAEEIPNLVYESGMMTNLKLGLALVTGIAAVGVPSVVHANEFVSVGVCVDQKNESNKFYILRGQQEPSQGLFVLAAPEADIITAENITLRETEDTLTVVGDENSVFKLFIREDIVFSKKGPVEVKGVYRTFTCTLK